jgi:hypothetical protein
MAVDNELEELRRRAYGRQADIHLDAHALERLRQLESERSPLPLTELDEPVAPDEPTAPDEAEVLDEPPAAEIVTPGASRRWWLWISHLRRSTVLTALGVLIVGVLIVVVLTVVHRVQTDPLQTGASQVARLSTDSAYFIPTAFGGGRDGTSQNEKAYQQFHGVRVLVAKVDMTGAGQPTNYCLNVYAQADVTDATSTTFTGPTFFGCAAGKFPAIVQFQMDTRDLPKELTSVFSKKTGLQFVYDEKHDEVVVFASK